MLLNKILISVHFPKSAGTSFLKSIQDAFGIEAVDLDYQDDPANPSSKCNLDPDGFLRERPSQLSAKLRAIHGHFKPLKYDLIPRDKRILVTILREPIDNIISIYNFWKKIPEESNPLHSYFLRKNLSIYQMANLPLLKNLMTETYFGNFDMSQFNYIGQYSEYENSIGKIADLTGLELKESRENIGKKDYTEDIDISRLKQILSREIEFYDKWKGYCS